MKEKFLFLLPVLMISLVLAVSCADDEEEEGEVKTRCDSNADCARNAYCDLDNPQQDEELGTLVYYCRKRQLCSSQADCPINWKCKENEGFCITNKEADALFCKSNDDCKSDPNFPVCNLKTGECEASSGGDDELPDAEQLPEEPDSEQPDDTDTDQTDTTDDADTSDDSDTDTEEASEGKKLFSDSLEDGGINWTIEPASEGAAPCWEIATPASGPAAAHIGSKAAYTVVSDGGYLGGCKDMLRYNNVVDVPSSGKPEISFYAWVEIVSGDYVEVLVKKDGKMWEETTGLYLSADTPSSTSALDDTRTKITGQLATSYYKFTGDMSAFKGQKVEIAFRFVSDDSENAAGFYLDDITLAY